MTTEKVLTYVGAAVAVIAIVGLVSVLTGTILWVLYPHIHAMFPTAATKGIIAKELSWLDSVCVTWIFSILIKGGSTSSNKKEK